MNYVVETRCKLPPPKKKTKKEKGKTGHERKKKEEQKSWKEQLILKIYLAGREKVKKRIN